MSGMSILRKELFLIFNFLNIYILKHFCNKFVIKFWDIFSIRTVTQFAKLRYNHVDFSAAVKFEPEILPT